TTSGSVTEFTLPTPPADAMGITTGPDGNLWFTEQTYNKIGRITTSGTITEFPAPTSDGQPRDITTGPDGNLWFTEVNANKIGVFLLTSSHITPTRTPTVPPTKTPTFTPTFTPTAISGLTDVALHKTATQSSTYLASTGPSMAVDGNTNGGYAAGSL